MNRAVIVGCRVQHDPETLVVPPFITHIFVFQDLRSPCRAWPGFDNLFPKDDFEEQDFHEANSGSDARWFLFLSDFTSKRDW